MYFNSDNFHGFKIVVFIRDKRLEIDCILFYFKLDLIIFMDLELLSLFKTKDRLMYFISDHFHGFKIVIFIRDKG